MNLASVCLVAAAVVAQAVGFVSMWRAARRLRVSTERLRDAAQKFDRSVPDLRFVVGSIDSKALARVVATGRARTKHQS